MKIYIKIDKDGYYRPADNLARDVLKKKYARLKDIFKLQENGHDVLVVEDTLPNSINLLKKIKLRSKKISVLS